MLESLVDLLESAGYLVKSYASAGALVEQGFSGIDALVTDAAVPKTGGQAHLALIRKANPDFPVFVATGRSDPTGDRRHDSGDLFRKPFDATALLDAIANALGKGKTGGDR